MYGLQTTMLDSVSAIEEGPVQVVLEVPDQETLVTLLETIAETEIPVETAGSAGAGTRSGLLQTAA